jgi:hypothetical protein
LAKLSAASAKNNGFRDKHHTVESIRKMIETKIHNGTLGRYPEKAVKLLRIAKELDAEGVDNSKIASLAMKQMIESSMKISKIHAYRILPQQYKMNAVLSPAVIVKFNLASNKIGDT